MVGRASSSVMNPKPWPSEIEALVGLLRFTKKDSISSAIVSPITATVIVLLVSPGAKVNLPLVVATKSEPATAVSLAVE